MKMKKTCGWLLHLVLAAGLLAAGPATAADKLHARLTGEQLQGLMQDLGYRAQLGVDDAGDPMIDSTASGYKYRVLFYDCEGDKGCGALEFWAGFDADEPGDLAKMNEWNLNKRFGRAYLDEEGDPIVTIHYNLAGGVTQTNIEDMFEWWELVVAEFAAYVGF